MFGHMFAHSRMPSHVNAVGCVVNWVFFCVLSFHIQYIVDWKQFSVQETCRCADTCIHTYVHAYTSAYMHAYYIGMYILYVRTVHPCIHAYTHTSMYTHIRTCMHTYVCTYVQNTAHICDIQNGYR